MKIFFLSAELGYDGSTRQLSLLTTGLPSGIERLLVALGDETGFFPNLRQHTRVDCLGWRRLGDVTALWRLWSLLRNEKPDIVHVWGLPALRVLRLVGKWRGPVVLSQPFERGSRTDRTNLLDRWLLRGVHVVVSSQTEVAACRRLGVKKVTWIPPAVAPAPEPAPRARFQQIVGRPLGNANVIVCMGRQERYKGYRDAIWAFDILRYVISDLYLLLIGDGSYQERLRDFTAITGLGAQIHMPGWRFDGAELLAAADVVWVPSWHAGGANVLLEAMAASRPVLASNLPELAELVPTSQTSILVPAADKAALARQTKTLLEDEEQRRWLGAALCSHVRQQYPLSALSDRYVKLYESL